MKSWKTMERVRTLKNNKSMGNKSKKICSDMGGWNGLMTTMLWIIDACIPEIILTLIEEAINNRLNSPV